MTEQRELEVTNRSIFGKSTKKLRREGTVPGNIYGHGQDPIPVQFSALAFDHLTHQRGGGSIVALKGLSSSTETVLVRRVQRDAVKGKILHVDFTRVSMDERIESKVPLHFIGEAPAVKLSGGVLLHLLEALPIECNASDIVESLDVDISGLADIDAILYAREVKLPSGYTLNVDPEEPIAKVAGTRAEQPAATAETPAPAAGAETPGA